MVIAMMSVLMGMCAAIFAALLAFMFQTGSRFTAVEARIDALGARLDARLDNMDQRLRVVETRPT